MQSRPGSGQSSHSNVSATSQSSSSSNRRKSAHFMAMKEIESWATRGRELSVNDFSRHSGQLMDNITEHRMLMAKLRELSKERYKFMVQNDYDRKQFLDKQLRKSAVMKEMLVGVSNGGRRKSWSDQALKRRETCGYQEGFNAKLAFLDRMDPVKNRERRKDSQSVSGESTCSKVTVSSKAVSMPPLPTETTRSPVKPQGRGSATVVFPTEPATVKKYIGEQHTTDEMEDVHEVKPAKPKSGRTVTFDSQFFRTRFPNQHDSANSNGIITDPRYISLTQSLASPYGKCKACKDVEIVIGKLDSLHVPAKKKKHSKLKMTLEIQKFISDAGLTFS